MIVTINSMDKKTLVFDSKHHSNHILTPKFKEEFSYPEEIKCEEIIYTFYNYLILTFALDVIHRASYGLPEENRTLSNKCFLLTIFYYCSFVGHSLTREQQIRLMKNHNMFNHNLVHDYQADEFIKSVNDELKTSFNIAIMIPKENNELIFQHGSHINDNTIILICDKNHYSLGFFIDKPDENFNPMSVHESGVINSLNTELQRLVIEEKRKKDEEAEQSFKIFLENEIRIEQAEKEQLKIIQMKNDEEYARRLQS